MLIVTRPFSGNDSEGTLQSVSRAAISCEGKSFPEIASVAATRRGPSASHNLINSRSRTSNSAFHSSLIEPPGSFEQITSSAASYFPCTCGRLAEDKPTEPQTTVNKHAFRIARISLTRHKVTYRARKR